MKGTIFLLIIIGFFSCKQEASVVVENRSSGGALGTSYNITYLSNSSLDYQKEIDSVFAAVNRSMSTYLPDSDISKINQGDSTIVVDHMFREVFNLSKAVYSKTKGYFDPTVGILTDAWGFGPGKQIQLDSVKVDSLLDYVGFDKVHLSEDNRIVKASPTISFDFNAIAKGYAIDRLAMMLDQKGITDYLVEVGGEIVTKGENSVKKKPWVVGIDDPQVEQGRRLKILIQLKDKALASSGNYRKFRIDQETGKKFVHTIDPKTGFTKNSTTLGVTVLAETCAIADAYATAFMAMERSEALQLLTAQKELDAYIIYLDRNGKTAEFMTDGFKELVISSPTE